MQSHLRIAAVLNQEIVVMPLSSDCCWLIADETDHLPKRRLCP